jgi:hypothetical protein
MFRFLFENSCFLGNLGRIIIFCTFFCFGKVVIYVNYYNTCQFLDPAEIIQKRSSVEENSVEYYVHYSGCK